MSDTISRQAAIDAKMEFLNPNVKRDTKEQTEHDRVFAEGWNACNSHWIKEMENLPSAQPELEKYEYHYDHTDCIWYRPEARNRCPATCAQYRDGWNDAMNYIFRDGEGYRPFRRDKKYEG